MRCDFFSVPSAFFVLHEVAKTMAKLSAVNLSSEVVMGKWV